MKVLFLSQYFYPEPFSNGNLALSLIERGHEVTVVCCVPNYPEGRFYPGYGNFKRRFERWQGVNVIRTITKARGSGKVSLIGNYLVYPFAALASWAATGFKRHDVIFVSMPSPIFQALPALAIGAISRIPVVYWVQDIWPDSLINVLGLKNRIVVRWLQSFCRWVYRRADLVLVQSEAFRQKLEAMGVEADRIGYFPNTAPTESGGVEAAVGSPEIVSGLPPAKVRLMFAGNVGESQNLDVYLEAAKLLPPELDIQWVIVGDGRDLARFKEAVASADCQDRFVFTGRLPMEAMPSYFAVADAMLVSLQDTAIFRMTVPFKLQSYLAAGRPIVGSIGGEAKRIIDQSKAGFCAEPNDPQALAAEIVKFCALTKEARDALGGNGAEYYERNFSAERVYSMFESYLSDARR